MIRHLFKFSLLILSGLFLLLPIHVLAVVDVHGYLTDEGVECQALRSKNSNQLYTLVGDLKGFQPGDAVYVVGRKVEVSICMQGITLEIIEIIPIPIVIEGYLTDEGVECQALRSKNGNQLYTLVGDLKGFQPGDAVYVVGRKVEGSICMQGITLEIIEIIPPPVEIIEVSGYLTEGVECQALRSIDGNQLYTLVGDLKGFQPGDVVYVVGRKVEASICMQGITLEIIEIIPTSLVIVEDGYLTNEGVECQALRSRNGNQLYTLGGDLKGFRSGDAVYVVGRKAEVSICMQGITLEIIEIKSPVKVIEVSGYLTEGVECPALRSENGNQWYNLIGDLSGFQPGDMVYIIGEKVEVSICGGGITLGIIEIAPRSSETIYCVHDDGLNDSQFCYGSPVPTSFITALGPVYQNCDIEALDILHSTNDLYAAAGDDTPRPSHLYYVFKNNGDIIDLGNIGGTGFLEEIDALSFHPQTDQLWGWAQGEGLFVIPTLSPPLPSPFPPSPFPTQPPYPTGIPILPEVNIDHPICEQPTSEVPTIEAELVLSVPPIEVEAITWNWEGDVLYVVENVHDGHDPDSHGDHEDRWLQPDFDFDFEEVDIDNDGDIEGVRLWAAAYNESNKLVIGEICPNLTPQIAARLGSKAEIEGIESLPEDLLSDEEINPEIEDLLLVSFHGPKQLLYAVIITPELPFTSDPSCQLWRWLDQGITNSFNDIEGIAYNQ